MLSSNARGAGTRSRITSAGANHTAIASGTNSAAASSTASKAWWATSGSMRSGVPSAPACSASRSSVPPTYIATPVIATLPTRYTPPTVTSWLASLRKPANRCAISISWPACASRQAVINPPKNRGISRYIR